MNSSTPSRRQWLGGIAAVASAGAAGPSIAQNRAAPGANFANKIVYQLNKADPAYQEDVLNSVSALLSKYVDDISIVVAVWGPGIHLLATQPQRPVAKLLQDRVRSMAEFYGVTFIACNNTMRTIGWTDKDLLDFVKVEDFGAATVMHLQQQGYAYLAW